MTDSSFETPTLFKIYNKIQFNQFNCVEFYNIIELCFKSSTLLTFKNI